ncbi:MAG: YCF48-related protein [Chitinophagaceae bacterium]|nr:YCF48-related protein [Chitinophagaceae bacterium]
MIRTDDQGENWHIARTFQWATAFDVKGNMIVVGGGSGLFVSLDNGATWKKSQFNPQYRLVDIDIVSSDTVYMVGEVAFYKSYDGGMNWQETYMGGIYISCFDFADSKVGFIGRTNTSMLKTTNGGESWEQVLPVFTTGVAIRTVKCLNRDTVFFWREQGLLYKTTDRGNTWTSISMGQVNGISFPTASKGFAAGGSGRVWTTENGGDSWQMITSPEAGFNRLIYSVHFVTTQIGFTVGLNGQISKTVDGGLTWKRNAVDLKRINTLSFPTSNIGFTGIGTTAYKTQNRGKTWQKIEGTGLPVNANSRFENSYFFSSDTGLFSTHEPARILKTNDGGITWSTSKFFANNFGTEYTENRLFQVLDESLIYLLMFDRVWGYGLFKSKDKGETWKKIDSTKSNGTNFSNFFFLDEKTGFATRAGYELWKTTDSAKTWSIVRYYFEVINKMYFINEYEGFILESDKIRRTADGGKTWVALEIEGSVYTATPLALMFTDENTGYYSDKNGTIFKTIDRGNTWRTYDKVFSEAHTIIKGGDSEFFIAGDNGLMASVPADSAWGTISACHGSNFVFLADSGYSNFSYQWQINKDSVFNDLADDGIHAGTQTFKLTIHGVPASFTRYQYRCKVGNAYSRIFTFRFVAHWTGAVDNNWENASNWSCGVVPDLNTDVYIGSGNVTINLPTTIRSLTIDPDATLNIAPGVVLDILH